MTAADLAPDAYAAYATHIEWRQPQGREQPVWRDLGETYQGAWVAAVARALQLAGVELGPEEDD